MSHLAHKDSMLKDKMKKQVTNPLDSNRSNQLNGSRSGNLKVASRDIVLPGELVHRMIDYDPDKEK